MFQPSVIIFVLLIIKHMVSQVIQTYMGRPAADTFGFTFGGTEMVRMGYVPSIAGGGIGINRTSIGARLHIQHVAMVHYAIW